MLKILMIIGFLLSQILILPILFWSFFGYKNYIKLDEKQRVDYRKNHIFLIPLSRNNQSLKAPMDEIWSTRIFVVIIETVLIATLFSIIKM